MEKKARPSITMLAVGGGGKAKPSARDTPLSYFESDLSRRNIFLRDQHIVRVEEKLDVVWSVYRSDFPGALTHTLYYDHRRIRRWRRVNLVLPDTAAST